MMDNAINYAVMRHKGHAKAYSLSEARLAGPLMLLVLLEKGRAVYNGLLSISLGLASAPRDSPEPGRGESK